MIKDVKEIFTNFKVRNEQRRHLRFLWWDWSDSNNNTVNLKRYLTCFLEYYDHRLITSFSNKKKLSNIEEHYKIDMLVHSSQSLSLSYLSISWYITLYFLSNQILLVYMPLWHKQLHYVFQYKVCWKW